MAEEDSNCGPPSTVLRGRGWAGGLTCHSLEPAVTAGAGCPPLPAGPRLSLACSAATSANGAGMRWAKVAHRAPDEGCGVGGRRVGLQPHQSLDDPTEPQALDA
jgi:hypothetical protein